MKSFYKLLFVSFVILPMGVMGWPGKPGKKFNSRREFISPNTQGFIGTTEESPSDNPADNIFHVSIDQPLCGEEKVWLVYELEGVEDHSHVSRSINDQLSVGGYIVKRRRGWSLQREQVNASWLKSGDNVIRFTRPENSLHSYSIKNLRVEVETADQHNDEIKVVFNQTHHDYFFDKAYVKGFISGAGYQNIQLKIRGKYARTFNGEFESIIDFDKADPTCTAEVEIIYPDGTSSCDVVTFSEPIAPDFVYPFENVTHRTEKFFGASVSETLSLHGAGFTAQASALKADAMMSITTLRAVDIPALDAGMINVTANSAGFRFLPHGTVFNKEISITIPFDPAKIPDGYTHEDIKTYFFDEQTHHWIALPADTVLSDKNEVISWSTHFTDLINGIIKVPESPEVEAHNSTSMKGIKAANPTAGITLINPPQPNNSGSAAVGYPINIPAGRSGMQPQLAISYNSSGGNGWVGLGWNLSTPSIGIDTRWGVPRYSRSQETETYTLNGEQLTPFAHRSNQFENRSAEKRFYPRVEGAFQKIIRHGNSPANYWWEVTDKSGTRYFYGGIDGSLDEGSVLRTNEGSTNADKGYIAQWCLRQARDLNGNTVDYRYTKIAHPGVNGGSMGHQIYVSKITYTGFKGLDGPYSVELFRDQQRTDRIVTGNLGFKQVTADKLNEIVVRFEGKKIRSYKLKYKVGAFSKTLLDSLNEYDSKDKRFTAHKFEYYNEVGTAAQFKALDDQETWNPHADGVKGKFLATQGDFTDKASALSGTKGKDKGLGMTVTAGIADGNMTAKSLTVGGSFGYSESESEGLLSLIDINGDGLTDKVYIKDGKLLYRSNTSGVTSNTTFGDSHEILLSGTNNFHREKSKTLSTGLEANAGYGSFSAFVGWGKSKTTSVTSVYLSEVNGDQLADLVVNGKVFFNHIDPATGHPVFTASSADTPSPIKGTGTINGNIITVDEAEKETAITENPLHDVVRMWRAPLDGKVRISGGVKLLQSLDPARTDAPADGVIAKIQHNERPLLWSSRILQNDYSEHRPENLTNIAVQKGDRIFFRLQSVDNGSYDSVLWSPQVEYIAPGTSKPDTLLAKDANRKPIYIFSAEKDYVHTAQQTITPPFNGTVKIEGDFFKPVTSDSIRAEILQIDANKDTTVVWEYRGAYDESGSHPSTASIVVDTTEYLVFRVASSTNVNWSQIKWQPHMFYVGSSDTRYRIVTGSDGKPDPLIEFYPIPEFSIFPDMRHPSRPWVVPNDDITTVDVTPELEVSSPIFLPPLNGVAIFSIKKPNELIYKDTINIVNGVVETIDAISVDTEKNDSLYVEFHFPDATIANRVVTANVYLSGSVEATLAPGIYTVFSKQNENDVIYGTLYRQWGQFVYNGNRNRAEELIHLADLRIDDKLRNAPSSGSIHNSDDLNNGAYNPAADKFVVMTPRGKDKTWGGYDAFTFLNATVMSSSRLGEKDLSGAQAVPGGGATAVNKVSKSESASYSAGAGVGVVGGSYNNTYDAFSHLLVDYMDMNGDRYPDIVTDQKIQYTTSNGGFETEPVNHGQGINHKTSTTSDGYSVSGSFVTSKTEGSASNAKNTRTSVGNAKVSGGISGNFGKGDNDTKFTWMDINGDGLPDKVFQGGMVALNLGYSFTAKENWGFGDVQKGHSESKGAGLSINIGTGSQSASFAAGVGLALSENYILSALQDVNGDGLADQIYKDNGVKVKLNNGSGFSPDLLTWNNVTEVNKSSTASQSANVSFTGCFPIWVIKICINPSVNVGNSVSRDLYRLTDIDGDGYPDYITSSDNDGDLHVYRSKIGRTNMLKTVKRPMGATFTISYARMGNTYEMPNSAWVMDSLKITDGFLGDGVDNTLTSFSYEGGHYDRHEREFYGFKKVISNIHDTDPQKSNKPVYSSVTQNFKTSSYYEKGLMESEVMTDAEGKKFGVKENIYELKNAESGAQLPVITLGNDPGRAFPALKETRQQFFEGNDEPGKTTQLKYEYSANGNITTFTDYGDEGAEDDLTATISYYSLTDIYVMGTPERITVTGSGRVYRKRESIIDPATGDVKQIKQFLSDAEISTYDMDYDDYGNLNKITRPANSKGQRMTLNYTYDDKVHTYATKVTNSYGYTSESAYDFSYGQLISSKDMNGNEIKYELDDAGRIKNITGPYEKGGANKTIEFEYFPNDLIPSALTKHFDPSDPKNYLQTVVFTDGLGRVLQTKKDISLFGGDGKIDTEVMSVSGRVFFDAFGRTVKSYYPVTSPASTPKLFVRDPDTVKPTITSYDVMNRVVKIVLPDLSETTTVFGFENDRDGKKQFSTKNTDANGKQVEEFTDVKSKVTAVKNYTSDKPVWISFKYNAVGEQIEVIDDAGHSTTSEYDNLGRRTSRTHPDAGKSTTRFDLAGNMIESVTANLEKEGYSITYDYDFERLVGITYPKNPENNVKYTYGAAGETDNRVGRIILQEDASGAQEFFYGPLGETVKNIRTVVIPQHDAQTFVTEWQYDTWNRLLSMTYADGEKVTYTYNSGGLLKSMSGKKKNATYNYVNQLGYDKFEQRVFLAYGNGTKTTYQYEADRRRLQTMSAKTANSRVFINNTYGYDKVGNVLSLKNSAPVPSANLMGGTSEYIYTYDDLYRLTSAQGSYKGANDEHSYTLSMAYNSVGRITNKTQVHLRKGHEQKKTTYKLTYDYGDSQPHAPMHIGDHAYTYDASGNQTGWTDDLTGQRRKMMWDEENRLRAIYDNGALYHYIYDAAGVRVLKGQSSGQRIFVNGEWKAGSGQMGNYTVYVNPYLVLRSGGYTKHYFIEGQRIVSKLGGGWDNNGKGPLNAGNGKVDFIGKSQRVFDGIVKNLKFLGSDGQILTAGKSGKIPPGQINGTVDVSEASRYFYHPDHVGSTSYITDASGEVYQHLEYFAFGETFVEEHSNTNRTPFLFNGKELDDETGLYYYGARYYDPMTSVFLSIDPLAEKYPGISPYAYAFNNPLKYSDPTGMEGEDQVAPAGHQKHDGANGQALYLPTGAQTETYQQTGKSNLAGSTTQASTTAGAVRAFTIGKARYVATYNKKSGDFAGYKNFQTGETYNNPKGLTSSGTIAKRGFGETRGLYPSADGSKVGPKPENWSYESSQQLMEARAAIEIVATRNPSVHPGASPSNSPNNAEYNQRPFAMSENFPTVDPVIANDPQVDHFYNASSATFIPGRTYVDTRYHTITLVKSYGPFYNASSLGDTKQGTAVYINFYKVVPKK